LIFPHNSVTIREAIIELLNSAPPRECGGFVIFNGKRDIDFVQYALDPNGLLLSWPPQEGEKERLLQCEACLIKQGYSRIIPSDVGLPLPEQISAMQKGQYMILDDGLYGQAGRDAEEVANLTFYLLSNVFGMSVKDVVAITLEKESNDLYNADKFIQKEPQFKNLEIFYKAEEIIKKHSATLKRKRTQLLLYDDYGVPDIRKWNEEKKYFINSVIVPKLGIFNLSETKLHEIMEFIEDVCNDDLVQSGPEQSSENLREPTPIEFEARCSEVLKKQGWTTRLTKSSGDQGVDIVAERNGITLVFQCKLYNNPVGNKAVQEAHAGKDFFNADLGIVVSNAAFTQSARELAASLKIILLHHSQLEEIDRVLITNARGK
jgi:HJR/Mrr/RecB family endonuclease